MPGDRHDRLIAKTGFGEHGDAGVPKIVEAQPLQTRLYCQTAPSCGPSLHWASCVEKSTLTGREDVVFWQDFVSGGSLDSSPCLAAVPELAEGPHSIAVQGYHSLPGRSLRCRSGDGKCRLEHIDILPAESLLGSFGKWLQEVGAGSKGELVKLEDPEFEEMFAVYSDDQVEARYILTPALMKRLVDFRREADRDSHIAFVNSDVVIAISLKRALFEPPIMSTILNKGLAREYLDDVRFATEIVDDLNLNTRIWTKE
jgi:hypothetical protein